jgi:membrane protease subunit HflK
MPLVQDYDIGDRKDENQLMRHDVSEADKTKQPDDGMTALGRALRISFKLLVLAMIASLFFFLYRSLFVVESKEVGLLFRFGRVVTHDGQAALGEGPHFAWPYPVDEPVRVPTIPQTVTVDDLWYGKNDAAKTLLVPGKDGYILTGDHNILHSKWTLRYRITDPLSYTLQFSDDTVRQKTIKALLRNAIAGVSASVPVDILYSDRESYRQEVRTAFVRNLTAINAGIEVEQLAFEWAAPRNLKDAFEQVTNAQEQSNNEISKAKGETETLLANSKLKAGEDIARAETEKSATISNAKADAAVFEELHDQYQKNPGLFKKLYYEERLRRILANLSDVYIIDKKAQRTLYIELNPPPKKKKNDGGGNE